MFLVTCMQNGSPSACVSEKQPPLEASVPSHSLQGVGRGLWDPVCLSLLFPVKASPVSQKLPSTCWVQSPCSPVGWLGESVVRKRVLSLMCGSGNHQPVVLSWEVMKPQIPRFKSRSHHLFLLWPWASYLHSLWLSFLNWRGWWSYSAIMTPFCCLHLDYQNKQTSKQTFWELYRDVQVSIPSRVKTDLVNKDMKRCSTSLIVRKMQIRATIRYLVTAVRMIIIGKLRTINVGVDV